MERLTTRRDGHPALAKGYEESFSEYSLFFMLLNRLADYEDTGLEPCDYSAMRAAIYQAEEFKRQLSDVVNILGCSDIEHLKDIFQAEKDGRLVVLPDVKYTDADGEKALQKAMWTCGNTNNPVTRYTADAIAEKLCREAKEDNPPLTPEELLELDGEPVWNDNAKEWIVVDLEWYTGKLGIGHEGDYMDLTNRYYRRRPEEGN